MTSRRWYIRLDFLQQYVNLILKIHCFYNPLLLFVLQVHAGFVNEHSDTSIKYATEQWLASLYGWTNWGGNPHYMTVVTRVNNGTEWLDDHPEWLYFRGDLLSDSTWLDSLTHSLTDHVVLNLQHSTLPKQKPIIELHVELIQSYRHAQIQVTQCQF